MVFPVSAVMLERIEEYQRVLREYNAPLMHRIQWQPTEKGNVEVLNDTADLYRYGDYTAIAEFLYRAVEQTISERLPKEVHYLTCYDKAPESHRKPHRYAGRPDTKPDHVYYPKQHEAPFDKTSEGVCRYER